MQATKYEFLDSGTDRRGASGQVAKVRRIADSKVRPIFTLHHNSVRILRYYIWCGNSLVSFCAEDPNLSKRYPEH